MRYEDLLYGDDNQCYGTCKYHVKDTKWFDGVGDWLCECVRSEYDMHYTDYKDVCDEWEGR